MTMFPEFLLMAYIGVSLLAKIKYDKKIDNFWIFLSAIPVCLLDACDPFSYKKSEILLKTLLLFSGLIISRLHQNEENRIWVTLAVLGAITSISAKNFLSALLEIELTAISVYLIVFEEKFRNGLKRLQLASFVDKYVICWITGTILFSVAIYLIYLSTETINFSDVRYATSFASDKINWMAWFLILMSFALRLGIFPFHSWMIDIAHKDPKQLAPLFCIFQISLAIVFSKIITNVFCHLDAKIIIITIGATSMLFGSFMLAFQNSIKKMLIYSMVSHGGMVFAINAFPPYNGIRGIIISFILIPMPGIFFLLTGKSRSRELEDIGDLQSCNQSFFKFFVSVLFLSLLGFPPFLEFWSKVYSCLFSAQQILPAVACAFVFNSIGIARIFENLWFKEKNELFIFDPLSVKMICFISLMTIIAVPFVYEMLSIVQQETGFA